MIQASGLSKSYGDRALFRDLSWQIGRGQRIALVGPNGAGKTTLARVLAGHIAPDAGEVTMPRGWRIGYLEQEVDTHRGETVLQRTLDALAEQQALAREVEMLQAEVARSHDEAALLALGSKQAQLEQLGYYSAEGRAKRILAGLGFREADFVKPVEQLSGGWVMRVSLARLLLQAPDLLLLDEPTNHLDLATLEWFEGYLRDWPGSIVVISHDRAFINRIATHVAELRGGRLRVWLGDYDAYVRQSAEERVLLEKRAAEQERKIAEVQSFVDRFRAKATKAAAVQSRVKALEKIERVEIEAEGPRVGAFRFPQPARSGKQVIELRGAAKSYGSHTVYEGLDLVLWRGDKVALVGPNGAGKSTLLKMFAGVLRPDRGERVLGYNVSTQYYAQHQLDQLDGRNTIYDELMQAATDDSAGRIRGLLGAFLFRGDDVHKLIGVLSGGEKARAALAKMLLEPANFLLLDEPTNHLDMTSRDALENALQQFDGTLAFISHDRHFINAVATSIIDVRGGQVERFDGSYDDYRAKLAARGAESTGGAGAARTSSTRRDVRRLEADLRNAANRELKPVRVRLAAVEERVAALESLLESMGVREAEADFFVQGDAVRAHYATRSEREGELEALMAEWEELGQIIEAREAELRFQVEALGGQGG